MFVDALIWFILELRPSCSFFFNFYTPCYIILFSLSTLLTIQLARSIVPQLQIAWKNEAAAVCPIGAADFSDWKINVSNVDTVEYNDAGMPPVVLGQLIKQAEVGIEDLAAV